MSLIRASAQSGHRKVELSQHHRLLGALRQPAAHGARGSADDAGDLAAGVTLQIVQQDDFSLFRGELAHDLSQGDRQLAGQRVEYHMYTWRIPQGAEIRQMQLALVRAGTLYTATCSALESDWAQFEAAFEMILSQLRFR